MAKSRQSPKPAQQKGNNSDRKNGKANKKNPRTNETYAVGKTKGGYSAEKLAEREARRQNRLLAGYEINK